MTDFLSKLPFEFKTVRYCAESIPDGSHDLSNGANCQRYAYAVLAHFGIALPPWRSSELWDDHEFTYAVTELTPLDLLLFAPKPEAFGAHVAVYAGEGHALHLSKIVGAPAIWPISNFSRHKQYAAFIGAKRAKALVKL